MAYFKPLRGLWGDQNFREEITAKVVKIATEAEVVPEDVTKLLQSHDNTLMNEELLLMNEQSDVYRLALLCIG